MFHLNRFASVFDVKDGNKMLTVKQLKQGYRYQKLPKLYRRQLNLASKLTSDWNKIFAISINSCVSFFVLFKQVCVLHNEIANK